MDLSRLHGIFPPILDAALLMTSASITSRWRRLLIICWVRESTASGRWALLASSPASMPMSARQLFVTTVKATRGRAPIIANVGDASTAAHPSSMPVGLSGAGRGRPGRNAAVLLPE